MMFNHDKPDRRQRFIGKKIKKVTRALGMFYDKNDIETSVADCLADLMHLCNQEEWSFFALLSDAETYHNAEQQGEDL